MSNIFRAVEREAGGRRVALSTEEAKLFDSLDLVGQLQLVASLWVDPGLLASEPATVKSQLEIQEGGSHYKDMAIQPVQYITANNIPFMEGNVIKYVSRHEAKNGAADIKKAIHFLNLILELKYGAKS